MDRVCESCGAVFDGSAQRRFCDACRRQRHNTASRKYMTVVKYKKTWDPNHTHKCKVCGKFFVPKNDYTKLCSPECQKISAQQAKRRWAETHREQCSKSASASLRKRLAAMSPEELRAYKDGINAYQRERYRKMTKG